MKHDNEKLCSFAQLCVQHRAAMPFLEAIVRDRLLVLKPTPDGARIVAQSTLDSPWRSQIEDACKCGIDIMVNLYVTAHFFANGPKVFTPSDEQAESLERTVPRVGFADYQQPYQSFAIEMPRRYREDRLVSNGQSVVVVVLHHDPVAEVLMATMHFSDAGITTYIYSSGQETLEQALVAATSIPWQPSAEESTPDNWWIMPANDDFRKVTTAAVRVAVNSCLLLCHLGATEPKATNPSHEQRLLRQLARAQKSEDADKIEVAQRELNTLPKRVEFVQRVTLHAEARRDQPEHREGDPTGRILEPHWRSGHIRTQRHGPRGSLVKKVFIRPVLVNQHLLTGSPANTTTYYRMLPREEQIREGESGNE